MRNYYLLAILAGVIPSCAAGADAPSSAEERLSQAQASVANWYTYSEVTALKLMDEYGPPDQVGSDRLVWHKAGPWDRIAVWDEEDYDYSGTVGPDNLEQTLSFAAPQAKLQDLSAFSDKLAISEDGKELSVRGNSEALDFLTINLAHEIVQGTRDPAQARLFYGRISKLSQAGKSSPYLQGLMFTP
jgi:hypothetical protein